MLTSTTPIIEGYPAVAQHGVIMSDVIVGAMFLKDFMSGVRDFVGGRARSYEKTLAAARKAALEELIAKARAAGGNALVGIHFDIEVLGKGMFLISASGTAITVAANRAGRAITG